MKFSKVLNNILNVSFSKVISLISGIVVGLLLPKVLTVTNYGYLKIYTLYVAYTALLHFGFVDGILLKLAGKDYDSLDKIEVRTYTYFFCIFQCIIGGLLSAFSFFVKSNEYSFIILMLGINMIITNITTYYQFISQATLRFREYSNRNILAALFKILVVIFLFFIQFYTEISYKLYIIILNVIDIILLCWYFYTYRDITFGKRNHIINYSSSVKKIFKTGFILTVAYQTSHLVLSLDRQFVSILFSTETYAVYSFAYNIITLISTMISSLSVVCLPMLKKLHKDEIKTYYPIFLKSVTILVGASLVCYFPVEIFIKQFLPNYIQSLSYIKVVLPSLLFISCINVVMFTINKVLDRNLLFFKHSVIILIIGFILNYLGYLIGYDPIYISIASILTMAIWFIIEGISLQKCTEVGFIIEIIYMILLCVLFLFVVFNQFSNLLSAVLYFFIYVFITLVVYRDFFKTLINNYINNKSI